MITEVWLVHSDDCFEVQGFKVVHSVRVFEMVGAYFLCVIGTKYQGSKQVIV